MKLKLLIAAIGIAAMLAAAPVLAALTFSPWGPASNLESVPGTSSELNTEFVEGCPILSRNGQQLYFASNRPGGLGGLDIWVSERVSLGGPFGAPVNMGAPINSEANDFCPSPLRDGHDFMFVSTRAGGCGGSDIYLTRRHSKRGWEEPLNLGCDVNSPAAEFGPVVSLSEAGPPMLYFSSNQTGDFDLYQSQMIGAGSFSPAEPVPGVNSDYNDARPSIRRDGRELVFDSDRPGGEGGFDLWSASRNKIADSWSDPVNLGSIINSSADEIRASLSWKAKMLVFGSNRPNGEGGSDIYFSIRD